MFFLKKNKTGKKQKLNILVVGGTRFFGIPMVEMLVKRGHDVTIATRGIAKDSFGNSVKRIVIDRGDNDSLEKALAGQMFDVVIDKIAYCSNDVKRLLENVICKRYVCMSSTAVYRPLHKDTYEIEYDPSIAENIWCERNDCDYGEGKRRMETAALKYIGMSVAFPRFPFVIGSDDYLHRIEFYVRNVIEEKPMNIDNPDAKMSFISKEAAAEFLVFLAENDYEGPVNGALEGEMSVRDIISYVEEKTGKKAIISEDGEAGPYNGTTENSVSTRRAMEEMKYTFPPLKEYMKSLLDEYIDKMNRV